MPEENFIWKHAENLWMANRPPRKTVYDPFSDLMLFVNLCAGIASLKFLLQTRLNEHTAFTKVTDKATYVSWPLQIFTPASFNHPHATVEYNEETFPLVPLNFKWYGKYGIFRVYSISVGMGRHTNVIAYNRPRQFQFDSLGMLKEDDGKTILGEAGEEASVP